MIETAALSRVTMTYYDSLLYTQANYDTLLFAMEDSAAQLLTIKQVAELLQVHEHTAWRYVKQGRLPCVRLGRRAIRIARQDLVHFIASNRVSALLSSDEGLVEVERDQQEGGRS